MTRIIYTTQYGSQLYGTSTPTSDVDIIDIMVPQYDDLLLQKTSEFSSKHHIHEGLDSTVHSLPKIITDVCNGNSTALEILFSTNGKQEKKLTPIWNRVYLNRHLFLTKQSASLIGYCRSQSKKYDVRGDKMKVVKGLLSLLEKCRSEVDLITTTVGRFYDVYTNALSFVGGQYLTVVNIPQKSGGVVDHLSICGRRIPFTIPSIAILESLEHLEREYGARTKEAADGDGVDWKGMMHSVRIAEQAVEYFKTGFMTFPRPNTKFLTSIRNKEIKYSEVSSLIDQLLLDVEYASNVSTMQEKPVQNAVDNFLLTIYEEMRFV